MEKYQIRSNLDIFNQCRDMILEKIPRKRDRKENEILRYEFMRLFYNYFIGAISTMQDKELWKLCLKTSIECMNEFHKIKVESDWINGMKY